VWRVTHTSRHFLQCIKQPKQHTATWPVSGNKPLTICFPQINMCSKQFSVFCVLCSATYDLTCILPILEALQVQISCVQIFAVLFLFVVETFLLARTITLIMQYRTHSMVREMSRRKMEELTGKWGKHIISSFTNCVTSRFIIILINSRRKRWV